MKKNKSNKTSNNNEVAENKTAPMVETPTEQTNETQTGETQDEVVTPKLDSRTLEALKGLTLPRGRKVNPDSARQKKLAEDAVKREQGLLKRGRPTNPESDRQKKLANKGEGKTGAPKGRKVDPNSERQKKIADREAKLLAYAAELAKQNNAGE